MPVSPAGGASPGWVARPCERRSHTPFAAWFVPASGPTPFTAASHGSPRFHAENRGPRRSSEGPTKSWAPLLVYPLEHPLSAQVLRARSSPTRCPGSLEKPRRDARRSRSHFPPIPREGHRRSGRPGVLVTVRTSLRFAPSSRRPRTSSVDVAPRGQRLCCAPDPRPALTSQARVR